MLNFLYPDSADQWAAFFPRNRVPHEKSIPGPHSNADGPIDRYWLRLFGWSLGTSRALEPSKASLRQVTDKITGHCHDFYPKLGKLGLFLTGVVFFGFKIMASGLPLQHEEAGWQDVAYRIFWIVCILYFVLLAIGTLRQLWVSKRLRRLYGMVHISLSSSPINRATSTTFKLHFKGAYQQMPLTDVHYKLTCLQCEMGRDRAGRTHNFTVLHQTPWKKQRQTPQFTIPIDAPASDLAQLKILHEATSPQGSTIYQTGAPIYWEIEIWAPGTPSYYDRFFIPVV